MRHVGNQLAEGGCQSLHRMNVTQHGSRMFQSVLARAPEDVMRILSGSPKTKADERSPNFGQLYV